MTKPQNTRRVKWIKSLRGSLKGTGVLKTLMKIRQQERELLNGERIQHNEPRTN